MMDMDQGANRPLALPCRFGSYLLFDRIGIGGMAEIYLARGRTRVGATRLAVVKLVLPALAGDTHFADMLIAEAKLAAQLSHANVVQTYDLGRESGRLYIAMEYVEGFDLNELLRRCTHGRVALPAEFVLHIAGEMLRALHYAHRCKDADGVPLGIVHRDVSPSNVLISFEGEVKLCDFGIARAVNALGRATPEQIEGKAGYMSPEHARGEPIDARADVFAASIVLWEMIAGRRLYKAEPGLDILALARAGRTPPLPDRGLPDAERLASIIARGLEPDRARRYPTALAMARELDSYAADNRLLTTPLRLGGFLTERFGAEIIASRRARERAATAIERGPAVQIEVVSSPSPAPGPKPAPAPVLDDANDTDQTPFHERSAIRPRPPESEESDAVDASELQARIEGSAAHDPVAAALSAEFAPPGTANASRSPLPVIQPDTPARRSPDVKIAPEARGLPFAVKMALAGMAIAAVAGTAGWLLAQH